MKALGMLVGILMLAAVSTSHASYAGTYIGTTSAKVEINGVKSLKTISIVVKVTSTGGMSATLKAGSTLIGAPKGKAATTGEFVLVDYRDDYQIAIGGRIRSTTVGAKSLAIFYSPDGQSKQFYIVKQ